MDSSEKVDVDDDDDDDDDEDNDFVAPSRYGTCRECVQLCFCSKYTLRSIPR